MIRTHGSCVARDDAALLLLGASGSGKSDLALRLLDRGFALVADDQVVMERGFARPPASLAGLLEIRGIGLLTLPYRAPVRVVLALDLGSPAERLPDPIGPDPVLGIPLLRLDPGSPAAAVKAELALDCVVGRRVLRHGFTNT